MNISIRFSPYIYIYIYKRRQRGRKRGKNLILRKYHQPLPSINAMLKTLFALNILARVVGHDKISDEPDPNLLTCPTHMLGLVGPIYRIFRAPLELVHEFILAYLGMGSSC